MDHSRPTLLFLGGSAWTSKTMPVLERLLRTPALMERLNVVVVCGRNERFHDALKAQVQDQPRVALFGFVNASLMARLMALADLPVLGSTAPASMHELMETRCGPFMLFHIIPGSEDAHTAYIQEAEIGVYERGPERHAQPAGAGHGHHPSGARHGAAAARVPRAHAHPAHHPHGARLATEHVPRAA
ncbi:hypothetical protein ACN28S_01255 [Cystobacter fuscus]